MAPDQQHWPPVPVARGDQVGPFPARVMPPGVKLRGLNLGPSGNAGYGGGWVTTWTDWVWTGPTGFQARIDRIKAAGMNSVRLIGGLGAVKTGAITLQTYIERHEQLVQYCRAQGIYVYAVGCAFGHINGASNADLISYLQPLVEMLNRYDNVVALDISQEPFGEGYSRYGFDYAGASGSARTAMDDTIRDDCAALYNALKPSARMSLTFSSSTPWEDPRNTRLFPYCDHLDIHLYWSVAGTLDGLLSSQPGKTIVLGEMGMGKGSSAATANGTSTLTGVTNPTLWRDGMLVDVSGVGSPLSVVSGGGTATLVLSGTVAAGAKTLTNTSARVAKAKEFRDLMRRPECEGGLWWADKWAASLVPDYSYFDETDAPLADVHAVYQANTSRDSVPHTVTFDLSANTQHTNPTNGAYTALVSGSFFLGRPCVARVRSVIDWAPGGAAGQTYQTLVQIDGAPAPSKPTAVDAVPTRHQIVQDIPPVSLGVGSHTVASFVSRAIGNEASSQALAGNTYLTVDLIPV